MENRDIQLPKCIYNIFLYLSCGYITYKKEGFIESVKTIWRLLYIDTVKYRYNHWKWFRNRMKKAAKKNGPVAEILLEMAFSDNCDFDKLSNKLKKLENYENI